eukprot:g401.t1
MSTRNPLVKNPRLIDAANRAFDEVAGSGVDAVSVSELGRLLRTLGLPASSREQAVALRQFQLSGHGTSRINRSQFKEWYLMQKANFSGASLNKMLIKDQLGKSRTTSYELPGQQFTYGIKTQWGQESAGAVALTWKAGNLSKQGRGKRNIVAENKACVQAGACSTKGWQQAREQNKRYSKVRTGQKASRKTNPYSSKNLTYGKNSEASPAVSKVLATNEANENFNYADLKGKRIPGRIPKPRPTHSSDLLAARAQNKSNQASKEPFKLTKFKKITSKINSNNKRNKK